MDPRENQLITCPYNVSHQILLNRMQTHLTKCRKNYPDQNMVSCPFNATHEIPAAELNYHKEYCSDRISFDKFVYVEEAESSQAYYPVKNIEYESSENWDDAPAEFYDASKYCAENEIVRPLNCAPAAQRRNFRMEERRRIQSLTGNKPSEDGKVESQKRVPLNLPKMKPNIDENDSLEETDRMKTDVNVVRQLLTNAREKQKQSLQNKAMNTIPVPFTSARPCVTSSLMFNNDEDFPPPGVSRLMAGRGRGRNISLNNP